jgi:hypothetical protein
LYKFARHTRASNFYGVFRFGYTLTKFKNPFHFTNSENLKANRKVR